MFRWACSGILHSSSFTLLPHSFPAKLSLLNLIDVSLLNMAVKMATKIIFVDVYDMLVAVYDLPVAIVIAVMQK